MPRNQALMAAHAAGRARPSGPVLLALLLCAGEHRRAAAVANTPRPPLQALALTLRPLAAAAAATASCHRCGLVPLPSPPEPFTPALYAGIAAAPAHAQGLLAGLSSGPLTSTGGPLCANLSATTKAALRAFPAPAADQLCSTLLDGPLEFCNLGAMLEWGLASTAAAPPKCNGLLTQVSQCRLGGACRAAQRPGQ